ncbi:MAG: hypothetical protein NVS2B17_16030 [Candidatus Velthaea sp.]
MKNPQALCAILSLALLGSAAPSPAAEVSAPPVVHIVNFAFAPAKLTIDAGQEVTFVNDDTEPHTVSAKDKSFDSEGLDLHQTWKHRFAATGSFAYFCELHPYMKGRVVVRASGAGKNS